MNKGDRVVGRGDRGRESRLELVVRYACATSLAKLGLYDLRRTCCRQAGRELEQIQLLLGHASVQTTKRCLATEQNLSVGVNDGWASSWIEKALVLTKLDQE